MRSCCRLRTTIQAALLAFGGLVRAFDVFAFDVFSEVDSTVKVLAELVTLERSVEVVNAGHSGPGNGSNECPDL